MMPLAQNNWEKARGRGRLRGEMGGASAPPSQASPLATRPATATLLELTL